MPILGFCCNRRGLPWLALGCAFLLALPVAVASAAAEESCECGAEVPQAEEQSLPLWSRLVAVVILVGWSGLFSGLTLGLMGLDVIGLQMMINCDNKELSACAQKIMPVRKRGNMLLCTLLLGNVAVNSALAILSDGIFSGIMGFFISTALIVVFGEIIPQATCAQYALQIGSRTVIIVRVLMVLFFPLTFPMSKCLDVLLGQDLGQIYTTDELKEMVKVQVEKGANDDETGKMAKQVVMGALNFREKLAKQIMTEADDLYMLSEDTPLGYSQVRELFEDGHSRVPVFGDDRSDIKGMLMVKDLMLADPEDEMRLGDLVAMFNREVLHFRPDDKLVHVMSSFTSLGVHMGLVWEMVGVEGGEPRSQLVGAVTMEDIMEEILAEEIVDETDKYTDMHHPSSSAVGRTISYSPPDLGLLNPVWSPHGSNQLNPDEIEAAAAHLHRTVFKAGSDFEIKELRTIRWLVSSGEVQIRTRVTPAGFHAYDDEDAIYQAGVTAGHCIVVLQGNIAMHVGRERHRSEAGPFHVLGKNALRPGGFEPDFDAYVDSKRVRYLVITQDMFKQAHAKDGDSKALEVAEQEVRQQKALAASRMEARQGVVQSGKLGKKSKNIRNRRTS